MRRRFRPSRIRLVLGLFIVTSIPCALYYAVLTLHTVQESTTPIAAVATAPAANSTDRVAQPSAATRSALNFGSIAPGKDDIIKRQYLSLVYNEPVSDASIFDNLEAIYRRSAVRLPLRLIPCLIFSFGFNCLDYWRHECSSSAFGGAGNDQTFLAEGRWPHQSTAYNDNEWAEVTHWGMPEGNGYGCFFNVRKGTGVFMNVKRTLVVKNDTDAKDFFARKLGVDVPDRDDAKFAYYCPHALKLGYDTVQITEWVDPWLSRTSWGPSEGGHGVHQLILCSGKCETEAVTSSCIPDVEFRTGLKHDKPCECDESIALLNCGNSIAPRMKRADFCKDWSWGGKLSMGSLKKKKRVKPHRK